MGDPPVTKVEFLLTNAVGEVRVIAVAHPTLSGWVASWNARRVPSGEYFLQSLALDSEGDGSAPSPEVSFTVRHGRARETAP
jgi:hypothetical protein